MNTQFQTQFVLSEKSQDYAHTQKKCTYIVFKGNFTGKNNCFFFKWFIFSRTTQNRTRSKQIGYVRYFRVTFEWLDGWNDLKAPSPKKNPEWTNCLNVMLIGTWSLKNDDISHTFLWPRQLCLFVGDFWTSC